MSQRGRLIPPAASSGARRLRFLPSIHAFTLSAQGAFMRSFITLSAIVLSALSLGCEVNVKDDKPDVKVDTPKRDIEVHVDTPRLPNVDVKVDR
jgi:hypothetical protein